MSSTYKHIALLLVCLLTLNSTVTVLLSSWQMERAQRYVTDDAMLICTGNQVKWVSAEAFFERSEFVFIEPPQDSPVDLQTIDCTNQFLSDHQSDELPVPGVEREFVAYRALVARINSRPYTAFAYQNAQSRAPPVFAV